MHIWIHKTTLLINSLVFLSQHHQHECLEFKLYQLPWLIHKYMKSQCKCTGFNITHSSKKRFAVFLQNWGIYTESLATSNVYWWFLKCWCWKYKAPGNWISNTFFKKRKFKMLCMLVVALRLETYTDPTLHDIYFWKNII